MGLGFERAGVAVDSQQPRHEGDADQEPTSDLAQRALTAPDRIEDPLSEILRIGCHRSPPHRDLLSNRAPSNCSALYGVPYHVVAYCVGRNAMFWYRLEQSLGRNSVVGTTVRDPRALPQHLAADEHHARLRGQAAYVAVTAGGGC